MGPRKQAKFVLTRVSFLLLNEQGDIMNIESSCFFILSVHSLFPISHIQDDGKTSIQRFLKKAFDPEFIQHYSYQFSKTDRGTLGS